MCVADPINVLNPCYVFNCVNTAGGCGIELYGDRKEEVVAK